MLLYFGIIWKAGTLALAFYKRRFSISNKYASMKNIILVFKSKILRLAALRLLQTHLLPFDFLMAFSTGDVTASQNFVNFAGKPCTWSEKHIRFLSLRNSKYGPISDEETWILLFKL